MLTHFQMHSLSLSADALHTFVFATLRFTHLIQRMCYKMFFLDKNGGKSEMMDKRRASLDDKRRPQVKN